VRSEAKEVLALHEKLHVCDAGRLPSRVETLILALQLASTQARLIEVTDAQYARRLADVRSIIRQLQEALVARDWGELSVQ
jgi:hypothetical protein